MRMHKQRDYAISHTMHIQFSHIKFPCIYQHLRGEALSFKHCRNRILTQERRRENGFEAYVFRGPSDRYPRRIQVASHVLQRKMAIEALHTTVDAVLHESES